MDIFDQVEECGYVATKDGSEVYKVLYVDRERHFIVTEKEEILKRLNDCFWILRQSEKSTHENGLFYFFPHKQKQKYYQWVLLDKTNKAFISTSLHEQSENRIMGDYGYFTKESPPKTPNSRGFTGVWVPIVETEKEA